MVLSHLRRFPWQTRDHSASSARDELPETLLADRDHSAGSARDELPETLLADRDHSAGRPRLLCWQTHRDHSVSRHKIISASRHSAVRRRCLRAESSPSASSWRYGGSASALCADGFASTAAHPADRQRRLLADRDVCWQSVLLAGRRCSVCRRLRQHGSPLC